VEGHGSDYDYVFTDCAGTGFTEELCDEVGGSYASTCGQLLTWSEDEYCDDGSYGVDLNCEAFGFDGGACGGGGSYSGSSTGEFCAYPI
jgi:hypothetical protein